MRKINPIFILLIGFLLVLTGFVVPFLMVMDVLEPSFAAGFLSYGASFVGLMLGLIGAALLRSRPRE